MAKIDADGNRLISCGEDIIYLCEEYNKLINELFDKLSKISKVAWVGESANLYVSRVSSERNVYINFGNYLRQYGGAIKNAGSNINNIIEKWDN